MTAKMHEANLMAGPWTDPDECAPIKEAVSGSCSQCGAAALARYPVLSADGWFEVVKCQTCLHSESRAPWNRLGWIVVPEVDV